MHNNRNHAKFIPALVFVPKKLGTKAIASINSPVTGVRRKESMKPGIIFENIWHDEDMYEFRISSSDGASLFVHEVYVGYVTFDEAIAALGIFKGHVYGGVYDLEFGSFGPEYASGAFHARFHFQKNGKINITIRAQSEYKDFGKKNVASEATLYLVAEQVQLDNFIFSLKSLNNGSTNIAHLECA